MLSSGRSTAMVRKIGPACQEQLGLLAARFTRAVLHRSAGTEVSLTYAAWAIANDVNCSDGLSRALYVPAAAPSTPVSWKHMVSFDVPGRIRIHSENPHAGLYISASPDPDNGFGRICMNQSEALVLHARQDTRQGSHHGSLIALAISVSRLPD